MLRHLQQRMTQFRISGELLGAGDKPQVQPVFGRSQVAGQLGVVTLGIVDQISRMNLKKPCQQHARGVGQVRSRAALDLREVRLAQPTASFFLQRARQVLLRHLVIHAAQRAFDQAQVAEFFAELHITICNYDIAICNCQELDLAWNEGLESN